MPSDSINGLLSGLADGWKCFAAAAAARSGACNRADVFIGVNALPITFITRHPTKRRDKPRVVSQEGKWTGGHVRLKSSISVLSHNAISKNKNQVRPSVSHLRTIFIHSNMYFGLV